MNLYIKEMFGMTVNPYVIQSTLMEKKIEFDEQRNNQELS